MTFVRSILDTIMVCDKWAEFGKLPRRYLPLRDWRVPSNEAKNILSHRIPIRLAHLLQLADGTRIPLKYEVISPTLLVIFYRKKVRLVHYFMFLLFYTDVTLVIRVTYINYKYKYLNVGMYYMTFFLNTGT